jgi:hypothetical protein
MPSYSTKNRQALKPRFVRNAIPAEVDFADLINASLIQADDGIFKLPDEPLSVVGKTNTPPVLRFYEDASATGWAWQIQLSADSKAGLALASGNNQTRLFLDASTGNVGIGTTSPTAKLQVVGSLAVTGATSIAALATTGTISMSTDAFYLDSSTKNIGIGTITPTVKLQVAGAASVDSLTVTGPTSLAALTASGATNLAALTASGNIVMSTDGFFLNSTSKNIGIGTAAPGAKLHILEATGSAASANAGSLLIDHADSGGASSIVFRSKGNAGSDHAYLEYKERNPDIANNVESGLLTLGIQNDADDHIALIPSGNVGIGTKVPTSKLHVAGTLGVTGATNLAALTVTGSTNLAALTATGTTNLAALSATGATNLAALTATGATNLAALATSGNIAMSSDAFYLNNSNKNIGLGTTTPGAKLHILETIGTAAAAGAGSLRVDHNDIGGASSILFGSRGDGSDFAYLEYKEKNPDITNDLQAGLLTLSIQNDPNDHIALMPSGNVGIGTKTPGAKLTVQGGIQTTESITLAANKEIVFTDNGQIKSSDNSHRLLFRRTDNIMELREWGDIYFSPGSSAGEETAKMVVLGSGNVGIGTKTSGTKLTIAGAWSAGKDPASGMTHGGQLTIKSNGPQIDFIDTDNNHNDWSINVGDNKMYFVRQPWQYTDLVLDGAGNVGIGTDSPTAKLQVAGTLAVTGGTSLVALTATGATNLAALTATGATSLASLTTSGNAGIGTTTIPTTAKLYIFEPTGTAATPNAGSLMIDHNNDGGTSSIVFRSKGNAGSDYAYLEYRERNPQIANNTESGLLTLGIENDADDHIALMPSGNVGIGTSLPTSKLHVQGSLGVTGGTNLFALTATGATNLAALTATGPTSLAALATSGNITMSTDAFYLDSSTKNIGIGTTSPGTKLTIAGVYGPKDSASGMLNGGQLTLKSWAPQIDFIDTDHNDWSIHVNSNKMYFIRQPWEYTDLVLDGAGKVGIGTDDPAAKLHVAGDLKVNGKVDSGNVRLQATANDQISVAAAATYTDMPQMTVTTAIDGPVLVLFKAGGVQVSPTNANQSAKFRLLIDGTERAYTMHEFQTGGFNLRDVSLMYMGDIAAGTHVFKVQWLTGSGTLTACWYNDTRSLFVIRL